MERNISFHKGSSRERREKTFSGADYLRAEILRLWLEGMAETNFAFDLVCNCVNCIKSINNFYRHHGWITIEFGMPHATYMVLPNGVLQMLIMPCQPMANRWLLSQPRKRWNWGFLALAHSKAASQRKSPRHGGGWKKSPSLLENIWRERENKTHTKGLV